MLRKIFASFDPEGIFVYQAFKHSIADEAIRLGTFGKGFNMERMTWIKPSFGWMLYRSKYATQHRQEGILKIKLSHEGFQRILSAGISTSFEPSIFPTEEEWRKALDSSLVRYQWDPDRDIWLRRLERRAIQLGIRGSVVRDYANVWIIGIEDVTELAQAIATSVHNRTKDSSLAPIEQIYPVNTQIQQTLAMIETASC